MEPLPPPLPQGQEESFLDPARTGHAPGIDTGGAQTDRAAYVVRMRGFTIALIGLLMLGTLGVLIAGMVTMVRSTPDPARSNSLMRWRVILQGAALLLLALLMMSLN